MKKEAELICQIVPSVQLRELEKAGKQQVVAVALTAKYKTLSLVENESPAESRAALLKIARTAATKIGVEVPSKIAKCIGMEKKGNVEPPSGHFSSNSCSTTTKTKAEIPEDVD